MGQFAFDVDQHNFQQHVLETSHAVPVVVDFWAEWCGPCKTLKPILEKLADEYQGKFILAKVNADQNPDLAAEFGVRGIPSVKAVYQGRIVDEFSGAIPEGAVREFLARIIPSPTDELRAQAARQREEGDLAGAMQSLGAASQLDPGNEAIRVDAAEILLEQGQAEEAGRLLDTLSPNARQEDRVAALLARLSFARASQSGEDESTLRAAIATRPGDMDSRLKLANLLVASGRPRDGLEELLEMIRLDRSWNEETARKTMLSVFNMLAGDPLVPEYRRKLASALN